MMSYVLYNDTVLDASERRVLLAGLDLKRFEQNPVILLEHGWGYDFPIGKWSNIRIEGNELKADAIFDEGDQVAMFVKGKAERGFLNGASIGAKIVEWSDDEQYKLPNQRAATATKSELMEASIVSIGDNPSALKQVIEKSIGGQKQQRSLEPEIYTFKNVSNDMNIIEEIKGVFQKGFNELREEFKSLQPQVETIEGTETELKEIEKPSLDIEKVSKSFESIEQGIEKGFKGIEESFNELKKELGELKKENKALKGDVAELKGVDDKGSYSGDKNPMPITEKSSNVTQTGNLTLKW